MPPVGKVQATSSCFTVLLLTCLSEVYWEESGPPRYSVQVLKDRSSAAVSSVADNKHSDAMARMGSPSLLMA